MSRQSEIAALCELRDTISETKSMISMSNSELEKYEACVKELTGTKFVFQPLPTNQEKLAKDNYHKAWKDKFSNPKPIQKRVQCILTILMIIFSVLVFVDMCTAKGWFFTNTEALQKLIANPAKDFNWIIWVAQVVFSITCIYLPWALLLFEVYELLEGVLGFLVIFGISGFFFWALCSGNNDMKVFWMYLIFTAGSIVIGWLVYVICIIMRKIPLLSPKQRAFLSQQRQLDEENAVQNVEKEKKDRADWQAWWDVHKYELDEQMDIHMKMAESALAKAEALQAQVEASDVLGENEKDIAIIDWLLYFIKGHRADSIKEALQQYDQMQHNQKMLEIEREKYNLEVVRIQKENADRQKAMEMERYHQMQMQAQAARAADMQAQIAANTAATRDATERMRKEAAQHASGAYDLQQQVAADIAFQRRSDYYNN